MRNERPEIWELRDQKYENWETRNMRTERPEIWELRDQKYENWETRNMRNERPEIWEMRDQKYENWETRNMRTERPEIWERLKIPILHLTSVSFVHRLSVEDKIKRRKMRNVKQIDILINICLLQFTITLQSHWRLYDSPFLNNFI